LKGKNLEIIQLIWLEDIVDKLHWKHNVEEHEVVEMLENNPKFTLEEKGFKEGEDVYGAFGHTLTGRFLSLFFGVHYNLAQIAIFEVLTSPLCKVNA
jgi:hypothetical protein